MRIDKIIKWCNKDWRTHQPWGKIHPDFTDVHYRGNQVTVNDALQLGAVRNPKSFTIDNVEVVSPIAVGLISSIDTYLYGDFSVEAKLPNSKNQWPAFWLSGSEEWPPEIDIFEGYSGDKGNYLKFRLLKLLGFWNVQSNVHYKENGKGKMLGGKTHWLGFKNPSTTWNKYSLKWRPDLIEISYNDRVVRRVTNKEICKNHQQPMHVILNNMVTKGYDRNQYLWDDFKVKNFQYKQYQP